MPASKGGTALKHTRMVVTIDIRHQLMAIESNPMHGSDFIQKKNSKINSIENILNRRDSHRAKVLDSWLAKKKIRKVKFNLFLLDRFANTSVFDFRNKASIGLKKNFSNFLCYSMVRY